jgi:PAS domain S-box-containing protein
MSEKQHSIDFLSDSEETDPSSSDSDQAALFRGLDRESRSWRLILDTALDAVVVMNCAGDIVDWNDCAIETFGFTRAEAIGQNMASLIMPARYREAHHSGLRRYLQTCTQTILGKRIEISAQRKSGEEFPIELSISAISDENELVFVGFLRDISRRKRGEELQKLLLAELNHRVKNMLTVVAGIASQTARNSESIADFTESFFARVQALGRAHSLLVEGKWRTTPLHKLVAEILSPYAMLGGTQVDVAGPAVDLTPKSALPVSMILHELVTNAAKYGALTMPNGRLSVHWELENPSRASARVRWRESGVGPIAPPAQSGFGSTMIDASVRQELGGKLEVVYGHDGIEYDLTIPLCR